MRRKAFTQIIGPSNIGPVRSSINATDDIDIVSNLYEQNSFRRVAYPDRLERKELN